MSAFTFILASLRHHWRSHTAVALGVAVATAVLTGALLVGDSVRSSLRDLTLERLGGIEQVLVAPNYFRARLTEELDSAEALPAILLNGTLTHGSSKKQRRANQISVLSITNDFWLLGESLAPDPLADNEVYLTEAIASELKVAPGDEIILRISKLSSIPSDSTLGEKNDPSISRRFKLKAILPSEGLARFSMRPSQHPPRNAFVAIGALQEMLDEPERANAILVAGPVDHRGFSPTLSDYGIAITEKNNFVQITSENLVLPDGVVAAAKKTFQESNLQPAVTYLANTIQSGDSKISYSTVTGIDPVAELGPLNEVLQDNEIALNRWAADDLGAKVSDEITLTYYEPESTHGQLREASPIKFQLKAIVELEDESGNPTSANDPSFTPELPGVTDEQSIGDWDLPFELVEPIRDEDEEYWDDYSTTPKAFISLATAQRLWQSRWGTISLLRIPTTGNLTAEQAGKKLAAAIDPADLGFTWIPVKEQGLQASAGTAPFDALFLGFSFFPHRCRFATRRPALSARSSEPRSRSRHPNRHRNPSLTTSQTPQPRGPDCLRDRRSNWHSRWDRLCLAHDLRTGKRFGSMPSQRHFWNCTSPRAA